MSIPSNVEILALLELLETQTADDLESQYLELKPWRDPKEDMKVAVEYAACMANANGGVIVFGVLDKIRGRAKAIHGAKSYDVDMWRRNIYDGTRPHLDVEICTLEIPEGTGHLLVVRIPKGPKPPYGTAQGLFKQRVGKNCMPLDPQSFNTFQVSTGAIDWSGQQTDLRLDILDPVEIARGRNILRRTNPESDLLKLSDVMFLIALGALHHNFVTHTGLLLFGREDVIRDRCPQHQVHYVLQTSDVTVARNDSYRLGLVKNPGAEPSGH